MVVVVSEERGSISLCFGGNIARDLDSPTLRKALLGLFQKQKRRAAAQKPKEREVPKALEALPFERPRPPETEVEAEAREADARARRERESEAAGEGGAAAAEGQEAAKPAES